MRSLKMKKYIKRIVSSILAGSIILSTGITALADNTSSGSGSRVNAYINLAAKGTEIDEDITSMTKPEIRFLGTYVSNFFIPFGTEIGESSSDDEVSQQTQDDIKKSLQTKLNFSDDMSTVMTDTIMGLSRSSLTQLEFRVSDEYHKDYKKVPNFANNYLNFQRTMFGRTDDVLKAYKDFNGSNGSDKDKSKPTIKQQIKQGDFNYGYWGYIQGGDFIPAFDCTLDNSSKDYTASQLAYIKCLESVNVKKGYGFNILDFTASEGMDDSKYQELEKQLDKSTASTMSIFGSSMAVDCFGNIINIGGNHQYIVIPGAINPYTWVKVKEDGTDQYKAGTVFNMINVQSMVNADKNKLFSSISTNAEKKVKEMQILTSDLESSFSEMLSKRKSAHSYGYVHLRVIRGNADTYLGKGMDFIADSGARGIASAAQQGAMATNEKDYTYLYAAAILNQYPTAQKDGTASSDGGYVIDNHETIKFIGEKFKSKTDEVDTAVPKTLTFGSKKTVKVMDNFVTVDTLGAFVDKEGIDSLPTISYIDDEGKATGGSSNDMSYGDSFSNKYDDIKSGKMDVPEQASEAALSSIYVSYTYAGLYDEVNKDKSIGKLGYRMARETLPSVPDEPLDLSNSIKTDLMLTSIRDWLYYLLHPTDGLNYVRELITNKTNAFLVGWHNDMVGTHGVGATTGTTLYRSNTGYVTTPDLSEIEWTSSLIDFYNSCIPFLIVVMIVTMLFAFITGIFNIQKSLFGVLIFAVFLLMPVNLINGVVGVSNRISENLYGEKFTYWALVQQESYATNIDASAEGDDYSNYLRQIYSDNAKVYSNQGSESIVLKWQAPKKMTSVMLSKTDKDSLSGLSDSGQKIINGMLNNAYSGESYVDNQDVVYMYRSYLDIGNFSRYIYKGIDNDIRDVNRVLTNNITSNFDADLKEQIQDMATNYEKDRNAGYTNKNGDQGISLADTNRITVPMSSAIVNDALGKTGTIKDLKIDNFVGLNQNLFNFSIPVFNKNDGTSIKEYLLSNLQTDTQEEKDILLKDASNYSDRDFMGLAAYGLYSENPFYYFSWDLYDMGLETTSTSGTNGYKDLLLGEDEAGFFYNKGGNGELKDFMDMKSLFTYIIPYLRQANQLVLEWDETYGIFLYEGVPFEEGHWGDDAISSSAELKQKYWHNLNVARLYGMYSPWVDILYDCIYSESETIKVMGETKTVSDPIDPASYPKERPMVFSESEMVDYGLSKGDLTKVERKILDCNKGMQERMYELLNYYNFSDVSLNTAAAMNCAFEFNTTFSETGFFKDNHNIYPQSFELADFSYDAFLRFILANTTGEDMLSQDDFYNNIVQNSSMTTVLVMLILDVISVYLLPAFKLFFIIAVFLSAIFIIIVTAFRVDPEQKFIKKVLQGVVIPMILFFLITIGFSFVISLFMGTASNAVTQTKQLSIQMGDPVTVMLAMIAVNIVALILYFKVIKIVVRVIKSNVKKSGNFMAGVFGGAVALGVGAFAAARSVRKNKGTTGNNSKDFNESMNGTSNRAERRAGNTQDIKDKEENNTRRNDTKRETIKDTDKRNERTNRTRKEDLDKKTSKGEEKLHRRTRTRNTSNKAKDVGKNIDIK